MRTWVIQATETIREDLWAEARDGNSKALKQWLWQMVCDQPIARAGLFKEWVMNL